MVLDSNLLWFWCSMFERTVIIYAFFFFFYSVGKRKLDGGNQNQGESKRRYQSSWGNQPLAQQPLGGANTYGMNGAYTMGEHQWYQDSYGSWS